MADIHSQSLTTVDRTTTASTQHEERLSTSSPELLKDGKGADSAATHPTGQTGLTGSQPTNEIVPLGDSTLSIPAPSFGDLLTQSEGTHPHNSIVFARGNYLHPPPPPPPPPLTPPLPPPTSSPPPHPPPPPSPSLIITSPLHLHGISAHTVSVEPSCPHCVPFPVCPHPIPPASPMLPLQITCWMPYQCRRYADWNQARLVPSPFPPPSFDRLLLRVIQARGGSGLGTRLDIRMGLGSTLRTLPTISSDSLQLVGGTNHLIVVTEFITDTELLLVTRF